MKTDKPIQGNPDGLVNLLHYDDAAAACWAALKAGPSVCRGQTFLISDGHPQTRRQICESTLQTTMYRDCTMPAFANEEPDPTQPGKRCDGSYSNKVLQWHPQYESFAKFMQDHA
jgi:nucleoside-diphosphate-sugar epimerase